MESECITIFRQGLQEASRDFKDILSLDTSSKKRLMRELESYYSTISIKCAEKIGLELAKSAMANIKLAQLKVSLAFKKEQKLRPTNDVEVDQYIRKFTDDEYEAMEKLENFSKIDSLNSDSIRSLLMNRDDQIYKLIKEWYNENMENFLSTIDILSGKDVRGELSQAMDEKYRTRFQKISEGVISFIQSDPDQMRKLFNNYERVIKMSLDLENRREKIEQEIREIVNSEELESILDRIREATALLKNKEVNELKESKIDDLIIGLRSFEVKIKNKIDELESEKGRLNTDSDINGNQELKLIERKRIDTLIDEAKKVLEGEIRSNMEVAETIKGILFASANSGVGKRAGSYACTEEEARVREVAFFQSMESLIGEQKSVTVNNPRIDFNGSIKIKDLMIEYKGNETSQAAPKNNFTVENRTIVSRFIRKRFLKDDLKINTNFIFNVHKDEFLATNTKIKFGIDQNPLNTKDLANIMAKLIEMANSEKSFNLCILGSPNGFEDAVIDQIKNLSKGGIESRNFLIILKDMRDGSIYIDENNRTAVELREIIKGERDRPPVEVIDKIRKETIDEINISNVARLKSICRMAGCSESDAIFTWKLMENEKIGKISKMQGEDVFNKK
jgi:hypothetical protein